MLVVTALTLNACETPANRRELYNTSEANGPWHDYARRREAEAEVGLPPGSTSIAPASTAPVTSMPRTGNRRRRSRAAGPLQTDPTALPSTSTPAPGPTTTTTVSPAAAPAPEPAAKPAGRQQFGTARARHAAGNKIGKEGSVPLQRQSQVFWFG